MAEPAHFNDVLDALVRRVELGEDPLEAHVLIAAADYFATNFPGLRVFNGVPPAHECFGRIAEARRKYRLRAHRRSEAA
jgi:hypothetical protein